MLVMVRVCGYDFLVKFNVNDLVMWYKDMVLLFGVKYVGVGSV